MGLTVPIDNLVNWCRIEASEQSSWEHSSKLNSKLKSKLLQNSP